jgi:DNA-binding CsgD family transcriptional regulator
VENVVAAIAESCRSGLEPTALRAAVLPRLRRVVPIDALWWATVDPATLLFTQAYREGIPADAGPYFVENEFLRQDVNKWTELARTRDGVRTLVEATANEPTRSARYRDVFAPLGLEDELRAVLRTRGTTWGFLCLHRERGGAFTREERTFVQRIAPHLAEGIRLGLLVQSVVAVDHADSPGLILLAPDDSVLATNAAADQWLDELGGSAADPLPIEVFAVAAQLRRLAPTARAPLLRARTRLGRWATLRASTLPDGRHASVAVIIQEATPDELAPVVMTAYGLTAQELTLAGLVFRGLSTHAISRELEITENTVQDHLKSIFDKTGVRSRRELVATVLRRHYLPGRQASRS